MRISHQAIYWAPPHPKPRCSLARVRRLPAPRPGVAYPAGQGSSHGMGTRQRRGDDHQTPRGSRRPWGARTLGGGPDHRLEQVRNRNPSRALNPLYQLGPSASSEGLRAGSTREERPGACWLLGHGYDQRAQGHHEGSARPIETVIDPGRWHVAIRPYSVHERDRGEGLLRSSPQSVAARH
jgi:hypothetical protein